jgi:type III secretion protein V
MQGVQAAPEASGAAAAEVAPKELPFGVSPLILDLAPDLTALTQEDGGRFVSDDLNQVRDQVFLELGLKVPGIRVRTGAGYLPAGTYAFMIDEIPCGRGVVHPSSLYALAPPADLAFLSLAAEPAQDPTTGRPLSRFASDARARVEAAQVPIRTPRQLVCEHLTAILKKRAAALLGVQEVQAILEGFEPQAPALVKEALGKVPLPLLTEVLRKLAQEEVSIRNIRAVLEALVSPTTEGDASALAERCRQALHRYLSHKYAPTGPLYAYLVDPAIEEVLRDSGSQSAAEPAKVTAILEGVRRIAANGRAVVLASPDVRRRLRKLCEGAFPDVAVLTYGELDADLQIRPIGRLAAALT